MCERICTLPAFCSPVDSYDPEVMASGRYRRDDTFPTRTRLRVSWCRYARFVASGSGCELQHGEAAAADRPPLLPPIATKRRRSIAHRRLPVRQLTDLSPRRLCAAAGVGFELKENGLPRSAAERGFAFLLLNRTTGRSTHSARRKIPQLRA
jgi:hypothetical protein